MELVMSSSAIKSDQEMGVPLYEVSKIYADPSFNCRGNIRPIDVVDLAKSIKEVGLQQPLVIRPRLADTPPGFDYVCVSGHRRLKAYAVNGASHIPAILRNDLTEFQARTLNAIENLKRLDLNIMQEARCVEPYHIAGWSRDQIAHELDFSPGWVQIRIMLLKLEPEIQDAAAAGVLTSTHIRDLYAIKDPKKRLTVAKLVKEKREKSDGRANAAVTIIKKVVKPQTKRQRKPPEIQAMVDLVLGILGTCFASRLLAWANGNVSDIEIHTELSECAAKLGKTYVVPDFSDNDDSDNLINEQQ